MKIENGKPVVVPGKEGVGLQPEEMAQKLLPVIDKTGDERKVAIKAKVVDPLFTTEDAKALKINERISSFMTKFPYAEYRNINQSRAAALINGTIVKPGETFSFNKTVGERTVANGFVSGTVINGGVFREELGGGVSQVVTTTYNAALLRRHGRRRAPPARVLHQPLSGGPRGDGLLRQSRPALEELHQVRRADPRVGQQEYAQASRARCMSSCGAPRSMT